LLLFVALLPGLLQQIPLAALAAMLVFTGIRLANPSEFRNTLAIGPDQLAVFVTTLVMTLATDLLVGVMCGFALKVALHLGRGAPLRALWNGRVDLEDQPDVAVLFVRDAAVFSNLLALRGRIVEAAATHGRVVVDFRGARLVDHTVMEALHELEDALYSPAA
jgi:MFS superfamily sulfate permease-like transporter